MYNLCRDLRFNGQNELAFSLAQYMLTQQLDEKDRALYFYEHTITSFYVNQKEYGQALTDYLLLLGVPLEDWIRRSINDNSIFYTEKLHGNQLPVPVLRPSFNNNKSWTDNPEVKDGYWRSLNPSLIPYQDGYLLNCRVVNYLHQQGRYTSCEADGIIRTRNFLIRLNSSLQPLSQIEICDRTDEVRYPRQVQGLEDCRICLHKDMIHFTTTTYDNHNHPHPLISVGTYSIPKEEKGKEKREEKGKEEKRTIDRLVHIPSPRGNSCEKNWLPFIYKGSLAVIYGFEPLTIYSIDPKTGKCQLLLQKPQVGGINMGSFRGSASPIRYRDGYLTVIHEVLFRPQRHYFHRIVEFDTDFNFRRLTPMFYFRSWGVEYCAGACVSQDQKSMLLTFGYNDGEAWIHSIPLTTVESMLKDPRHFKAPAFKIETLLSLLPQLDAKYHSILPHELFPSSSKVKPIEGQMTPLNFIIPGTGKWRPLNPSLVFVPDGLRILCRTSNYTVRPNGAFEIDDPDRIIRSRNFMLEMEDKTISRVVEVVEKIDRYIYPSRFRGLEDPRLFVYQDQLWFTATSWETQERQVSRITLCRLDKSYGIDFLLPLLGPDPNRVEKNWMPFSDRNGQLQLIYSYRPLILYTPDLKTGACTLTIERNTPIDWDELRGGGGFAVYENGYLFIVHEVITEPSRIYYHRFLWLSFDYSRAKLTKPFYFKTLGIEFAAGLCFIGSTLFVTGGLHDQEAFLYSVKDFNSWWQTTDLITLS